jgi:hypothetical protein
MPPMARRRPNPRTARAARSRLLATMGNELQVVGRLTVGKRAIRRPSARRRKREPDPHRITVFDEEPKTFARFRARLLGALAPTDALERFLADRVVACAWRLRRVYRVESGLFAKARSAWREGVVTLTPDIAIVFLRLAAEDDLGKLQRYELGLERSLGAALREFRRCRMPRMKNGSLS